MPSLVPRTGDDDARDRDGNLLLPRAALSSIVALYQLAGSAFFAPMTGCSLRSTGCGL